MNDYRTALPWDRLHRLEFDYNPDCIAHGDQEGFTQWVQEALTHLELTQSDLATLLEVSPNAVSGWLSCKAKWPLTIHQAVQLGAILDAPLWDVVGYWMGTLKGRPY